MVTLVEQSSQWLPESVVPASMVAVAVAKVYPHGVGVIVGVLEGVNVRVAVGGVPVGVLVGVPRMKVPNLA